MRRAYLFAVSLSANSAYIATFQNSLSSEDHDGKPLIWHDLSLSAVRWVCWGFFRFWRAETWPSPMAEENSQVLFCRDFSHSQVPPMLQAPAMLAALKRHQSFPHKPPLSQDDPKPRLCLCVGWAFYTSPQPQFILLMSRAFPLSPLLWKANSPVNLLLPT